MIYIAYLTGVIKKQRAEEMKQFEFKGKRDGREFSLIVNSRDETVARNYFNLYYPDFERFTTSIKEINTNKNRAEKMEEKEKEKLRTSSLTDVDLIEQIEYLALMLKVRENYKTDQEFEAYLVRAGKLQGLKVWNSYKYLKNILCYEITINQNI